MSRVIADGLSKKASRQYAELSGDTPANFTAMPQVGGDPIVESGSNADGEWTRWADGTQIAFSTESTVLVNSSLLKIDYTAPQNFTTVFNFNITTPTDTGLYSGGVYRTTQYSTLFEPVGESLFMAFSVDVSSASISNTKVDIVGRWK